MRRILAFVTLADDETPVTFPTEAVKLVPIPEIDPDTFFAQWNEGITARIKWETFCHNFFLILVKSGMIDKDGIHVDEYTPGSICRFIIKNKEMLPEDFRDSAFGMMILTSIKAGGKLVKKGKDIDINWQEILEHAEPMTEAVLNRLVMNQDRADFLQPLFAKYFPVPSVPVSPSDN